MGDRKKDPLDRAFDALDDLRSAMSDMTIEQGQMINLLDLAEDAVSGAVDKLDDGYRRTACVRWLDRYKEWVAGTKRQFHEVPTEVMDLLLLASSSFEGVSHHTTDPETKKWADEWIAKYTNWTFREKPDRK